MTGERSDSPVTTLAEWSDRRWQQARLPSWLASGVLHVCLAALLLSMSQWESCRGDFGGDEGEGFRSVGLRQRPAQNDSGPDSPASKASPSPNADALELPTNPAAVVVMDAPPIPLQLPSPARAAAPVLGLGPPLVTSGGPVIDNLIRPLAQSEGAAGANAAGGGTGAVTGGTSFLGVKDVGQRFVYVIDRSASMEDHGALYAAKQELLTSVERLTEKQEFQVIFYSNEPYILQPRDKTFDMFRGTDIQRLQARNQIAEVVADGGTQHFPALVMALKFNPDVIFLLTDGASESALTTAEMADLKRMNRNGTRIHCVEFGSSSRALMVGNFLARLASQHSGQHVYRDITKLRPSGK